ARASRRLIRQPVAQNVVLARPRLDEVAVRARMDVAVAQRQVANRSRVELMADSSSRLIHTAHRVVTKLTTLDDELGRGTVPSQQTHLVALEETIADSQQAALMADARAVLASN